MKNRVMSLEHKSKLKLFKKGESGFKGRKHSEKSKKLNSESNLGINNPFYGKQHTKEVKKIISEAQKRTEHKKGKDSPNWRENKKSKLKLQIRYSEKYKKWRLSIFKRDNFTCQICKKKRIPLNVDHLKPFAKIIKENNIDNLEKALNCEELWNTVNARTLCIDCHRKTENFGNSKLNR